MTATTGEGAFTLEISSKMQDTGFEPRSKSSQDPIPSQQEVKAFESILQEFSIMAGHHVDDDHALQSFQLPAPSRDQYQLYRVSEHGRK